LKKKSTTSPFFCFIHYFDAHDYDPGHSGSLAKYRNKIGEVDRCIDRLIAALHEINAWENTILVITADHGDGFGEHKLHGHGKSLYDEVLRVPFIIRAPGILPAGLTVEQQVRHIDITPTILDMIDMHQEVNKKGIRFDGVSLMPLIKGKALDLSAYAETTPIQLFTGDLLKSKTFQGVEMMCLRTEERKYIYKTEQFNHDRYNRLIKKERESDFTRRLKSALQHLGVFNFFPDEELYDLRTDPLEMYNRAARNKKMSKKMKLQLLDLLQSKPEIHGDRTDDWSPEEEEAIREKLHTIGYLD
jgi:arylsulfatase A-like enzyme